MIRYFVTSGWRSLPWIRPWYRPVLRWRIAFGKATAAEAQDLIDDAERRFA